MTTWRALIGREMADRGESFDDVVSIAWSDRDPEEELWEWEHLPVADLDAAFDNDLGAIEGCPFTLWTHEHVYFPVVYDGAEWVASVPRNPNGEATKHIGGGA